MFYSQLLFCLKKRCVTKNLIKLLLIGLQRNIRNLKNKIQDYRMRKPHFKLFSQLCLAIYIYHPEDHFSRSVYAV